MENKKSEEWDEETKGKDYVKSNELLRHIHSEWEDKENEKATNEKHPDIPDDRNESSAWLERSSALSEEDDDSEFNVVEHSSLPYDNREVDKRFTPNKFSKRKADIETPGGIPWDIDEYSNSQVPGADGDMHGMPNWDDQEHSVNPQDRIVTRLHPLLEEWSHSALPNDQPEPHKTYGGKNMKKMAYVLTDKQLEQLGKLSGMTFKSGYYTVEEWKEKTGIDPMPFIKMGLIRQTGKAGLCVWTKKADEIIEDRNKNVRQNWHSLGVGASLSNKLKKIADRINKDLK